MSAQRITPGIPRVPPPRIGEPGEDNRKRLVTCVRHGVRGQQRRAAGVNVLAQGGFDLARTADAERHPTARATPEITAPVQPRVTRAPAGQPAHDNTQRAEAERHATQREPLARHERAGEAVKIGWAGHIGHTSANYQQIISKLSANYH
jgi:uncharacterized membrane protein